MERYLNPRPRSLSGELHHIIPKHAGGGDPEWNLIYLSVEDHVEAHRLRLEVYNEAGDWLAMRFYTNPNMTTKEAQQARIEASHKAQQENRSGFWDPIQQAINGRRGGTVQTDAKIEQSIKKQTEVTSTTLSNPMLFEVIATGEKFMVQANTIRLLDEFRPIFLKYLPEGENKKRLAQTAKSNFTSSLARIFNGTRNKTYGIRLLGKPSPKKD